MVTSEFYKITSSIITLFPFKQKQYPIHHNRFLITRNLKKVLALVFFLVYNTVNLDKRRKNKMIIISNKNRRDIVIYGHIIAIGYHLITI